VLLPDDGFAVVAVLALHMHVSARHACQLRAFEYGQHATSQMPLQQIAMLRLLAADIYRTP